MTSMTKVSLLVWAFVAFAMMMDGVQVVEADVAHMNDYHYDDDADAASILELGFTKFAHLLRRRSLQNPSELSDPIIINHKRTLNEDDDDSSGDDDDSSGDDDDSSGDDDDNSGDDDDNSGDDDDNSGDDDDNSGDDDDGSSSSSSEDDDGSSSSSSEDDDGSSSSSSEDDDSSGDDDDALKAKTVAPPTPAPTTPAPTENFGLLLASQTTSDESSLPIVEIVLFCGVIFYTCLAAMRHCGEQVLVGVHSSPELARFIS